MQIPALPLGVDSRVNGVYSVRGEWNAEVRAMVDRLKRLEPPKEKFELRPGVVVVDPERFQAALLSEEPKGARSLTGAFQQDLREYLGRMEGSATL